MVRIAGPASDAGSIDYEIDATEVTQGQYKAWLATNPPLPPSADRNCGWKNNSGDGYADEGTPTGVYTGIDADHHPVVNRDWCDAYAYCAGVGKRLCGAIGGGSNAYDSDVDANQSQWVPGVQRSRREQVSVRQHVPAELL